MLNPTMSSGCPLNRDETRLITPGVSILKKINRQMIVNSPQPTKSDQWSMHN